MARLRHPSVAVVCLLLCCLTRALARPDPRQKEELIQKRSPTQTGGQFELTADERKLNSRLMQMLQREMESDVFPPAVHFFKARELIRKSPIFSLLQKMPKGGALHIHDFAMVDVEWLLENVTYRPHCYMCYTNTQTVRFKFSSQRPKPLPRCSTWKLMEELRARTCNITFLHERIRRSLTLFTEEELEQERDKDAVWRKFEDTLQVVWDLIAYLPVFRDYYYQGLTELYKDNIMYLELRALLPKVHRLDGKVFDEDCVMKIYEDVTRQFQADHPDFYGAKIIFSVDRKVSRLKLTAALEEAIELKSFYPDTFAGFDMVGNEDRSKPLWYYEFVLDLPEERGIDLPYVFHAGERHFDGSLVDLNLWFALGFNLTRVGHAYNFYSDSDAEERLQDKGVALELCPVSNQVFKLVNDLREHPVARLMLKNHPIVIGSDYPISLGTSGLSYDFYEAFVGIGGVRSTLAFLKQWAMNSIRYSSMSEKQRKEALGIWQEKWNKFVSENVLD